MRPKGCVLRGDRVLSGGRVISGEGDKVLRDNVGIVLSVAVDIIRSIIYGKQSRSHITSSRRQTDRSWCQVINQVTRSRPQTGVGQGRSVCARGLVGGFKSP